MQKKVFLAKVWAKKGELRKRGKQQQCSVWDVTAVVYANAADCCLDLFQAIIVFFAPLKSGKLLAHYKLNHRLKHHLPIKIFIVVSKEVLSSCSKCKHNWKEKSLLSKKSELVLCCHNWFFAIKIYFFYMIGS